MVQTKCRQKFRQDHPLKKAIDISQWPLKCARDRSRTDTSVTSLVFETNASTNSATWAILLTGCKINHPFF